MRRQIIFTLVFIIIVIGGFFGYKALTVKEEVDPIDNVVNSYKSYIFTNLRDSSNLFQLKELNVKYDMTKESSVIKYNNLSISAYLIDDYLHIMVDDIDYKYPDIGEVDRLLFYKYCSCNSNCYRLVVLTEEGELYYVNFSEDIDFNDPSILKKINSEYKFKNIGYTMSLTIDDECGVNGLVGIDSSDTTIIFDNNLNIYDRTYFTLIKYGDSVLYIYPDGYVSLDDNDKLDNRFSEIYTNDKSFYLVGVDGILYELTLDNKLSKISNKKIKKIGYNKKDKIIIIFEDATAKSIDVNYVLR